MKFVKFLWREDKIQAADQRLDRLTKDEGLAAVAQALAVLKKREKTDCLSFPPHLLLSRLTVYC